MEGHYSGETWGLDIAPSGLVLTSGDDNCVFVFDPSKDKAISYGTIAEKAGRKKKIGGASTLGTYPPN